MNWTGRQMLWGVTAAIGLMWLIIGVSASNTFLVTGALIYGLALLAFIAADNRSRPKD